MNTTDFHAKFDEVSKSLLDSAREALLEADATVSREKLVAQIIMENLFPHPCDPEVGSNWPADMTTENKKTLVEIADHIGPDYAQALYHAAVFITRVA